MLNDFDYFLRITLQMLEGAKITVLVFAVVIIVSIPLGFTVTLAARSKFKIIQWIMNFYITVMRGTPLLLQLLFVYFALPYVPVIGKYLTMDRLTAACLAFIFNYAAYFAEIFRGGLMAIDKGQNEAAKVLGFSPVQTFIHIIIPQMARISLPALSNESITLVKDTSLLYAIGVIEISHIAKTAVTRDASIFPFVIAAVIYLMLISILTVILKMIERKFQYSGRTA